MINVLIFEDEPSALRRLKRIIKDIRPDWNIIGTADSVFAGRELYTKNNFDLILSDIQLSDGLCFEIFRKSTITKPIIFLTAYDQYAIKSFEFNSIHYLLKPIIIEKLNAAFIKFEQQKLTNQPQLQELLAKDQNIKTKILSKVGNKTVVINYNDIALIYIEDGYSNAVLADGKTHLLNYSLEALLEFLPENQFFRINRQQIINSNFLQTYHNHSSNRLLLTMTISFKKEIIVSKEKTPLFKKWLQKL